MKKKQTFIVLLSIIALSFTACNRGNTNSVSSINEVTTELDTNINSKANEAIDNNTIDNKEELKAYNDFFNGKITAKTSEAFKTEGDEFNYYGLAYGEYTYSQLKAIVNDNEMLETHTRYGFLDLGNDGINELALRFECGEPSYYNWTGILSYNGNNLEINFGFNDGYRTEYALYTSGYLLEKGSAGAGAYIQSITEFDEKGNGKKVLLLGSYYGSYATSIPYEINGEWLGAEFDNILEGSYMLIDTCKKAGVVQISVRDRSKDKDIWLREKRFINKLVEIGAKEVSNDEMEELCDLTKYKGAKIIWNFYNDGSEIKYNSYVNIDTSDEWFYRNYEEYYEYTYKSDLDTVKLVIIPNTTLKDFKVYSISFNEINEGELARFKGEELYSISQFKKEKPLVFETVFMGDIPNNGISFVDENGSTRYYSINDSGYDGGIVIEEIVLEK